MKHAKGAALAALALAATLGLATAQGFGGAAQAQVPERQALFRLMSFYLTPLDAMARGARGYDSVVAENAALNLAMLAQLDQSSLWPQPREAGITRIALAGGSTPAPGTEARARDDMTLALVRLATVAATGPEPMRDALAEVGQSCRACHAAWPELR